MHLGFNQQKGLSGSSFFCTNHNLMYCNLFFLYQAWALGQRIQLKPWILQSWWTGNHPSQRWLHVWKTQLWRRLPNQNQRVQVEKNLVVTPSLPLSRKPAAAEPPVEPVAQPPPLNGGGDQEIENLSLYLCHFIQLCLIGHETLLYFSIHVFDLILGSLALDLSLFQRSQMSFRSWASSMLFRFPAYTFIRNTQTSDMLRLWAFTLLQRSAMVFGVEYVKKTLRAPPIVF